MCDTILYVTHYRQQHTLRILVEMPYQSAQRPSSLCGVVELPSEVPLSLPAILQGPLRLPVLAAPMFLASGPALVTAQCQAGVIGSFPALNARPATLLDEWLYEITESNAQDRKSVVWGKSGDVGGRGRVEKEELKE